MNKDFAKDIARVIWQYQSIWWEMLDQDEIEKLILDYLSDNKIVLCKPPEGWAPNLFKKS
jgi:hypothetical protein